MASSIQPGPITILQFEANATDLSAGTSQTLIAPVDGYIGSINSVIQVAIVTGGIIKAQTGPIGALVDVGGATLTIPDAAAKGAIQRALATKGTTARKVAKGDLIVIDLAAAFNGGGALRGHLEIFGLDA